MLLDLQPGDPQLIGPFRLRGVLGTGGMGRVFLGASADGELAAVKVVHAGLAADPAFRARFQREVEVARQVSGPYTVPVIDADAGGPMPWLATGYVAGPSLEEAVADEGPMAPEVVLEMAARLAEGLAAIHAAGVVHRDLKPSNILLAPDGPRLIDFGVSRAFGTATLTDSGQMVGSPGFMSPEQTEGLPVGPPSDIFSLGAVLAFAATGQGPFGPGSTVALIYRVIHRPADLSQVPAEVRGLVERCLIKDPALRPTARDLLAATGAGRPVPLAATGADPTVPILVPPDLPLSLGVWEQVPAAPARIRPRRDVPRRDPPRQDRSSWRRHWRPLSAAALIAGLLGAAAGLVLTATPDPAPAAQSQPQAAAAATPSPATSAPPARSAPRASADRRTSPSGAGKTSSAAPSLVSTGSAGSGAGLAGSTPVADDTSPADGIPAAGTNRPVGATSPTVVSSPRPSGTVAPTPRPHPSASASPTPSAAPTPTSGGYGY
jgi:serine/threonine protein kinase